MDNTKHNNYSIYVLCICIIMRPDRRSSEVVCFSGMFYVFWDMEIWLLQHYTYKHFHVMQQVGIGNSIKAQVATGLISDTLGFEIFTWKNDQMLNKFVKKHKFWQNNARQMAKLVEI